MQLKIILDQLTSGTKIFVGEKEHSLLFMYGQLTFEQCNLVAYFLSSTDSIKKLSFEDIEINDEGLQIIIKALTSNNIGELSITHPKRFVQGGKGFYAILELLQNNSSLKTLRLVGCRLGNREANAFARALTENKTLEILDLGVNPIGTEAATLIIEAINRHAHVTSLNFWNVGLDDNLERFAKAVEDNCSLTKLVLCCNKINEQGAIILANHLKKNKILKYLDLTGNVGTKASNEALKKTFKRNYWMDELGTNALFLRRTSEERALQIERESPVQTIKGNTLSYKALKKIFSGETNVIITNYLEKTFKEVLDEHILSYVDLFKLVHAITSLEIMERYSFFSRYPIIRSYFNYSYFFELYASLNSLNLINKNNFKFFYLFSSQQKNLVWDLINQSTGLTNPISEEQKKCLNILLPNSKHLLFVINNIFFTKQDLQFLLALSSTNIERLHEIVTGLLDTKMLTKDSYQMAFSRISIKKPKAIEYTVEKKSRKLEENNINNSHIIINNSLRISLQHKPKDKTYHGGGFGKVKKGYILNQNPDNQIVYSIKKFLEEDDAEIYAKRGVAGNQLLGREAYYYKRNNLYTIVTSWQSGKALDLYPKDDLIKIPQKDRFLCILSGLADIEKLHAKFLLHGDIKSENFIVDFSKKKMSLIDFDGLRKKGSYSQAAPFTKDCLDHNEFTNEEQNFCDDVYATGLMIKELFPDLYKNFRCVKKEIDMLPIEYAVFTLVRSMTHSNRANRCTIENAMKYSQQIRDNINNLNVDHVNDAKDTFLKNQITVEDVLRGRLK